MADTREAWITGIGIVSCLGEGPDAHWQALGAGHPQADTTTYPPYIIHKIAPLNFDTQIPKKGDQRQMEAWQRIGTYAAGLALDSAGIKGNAEILARTDMIVAAGGGERDIAADTAILSGLPGAAAPETFLNERLMNDLRPTLFLAQLSNLLAGNISMAISRSCTASPARRAPSWARNPQASMRSASRYRESKLVRAILRWSAAATTPSGRTS
jgi:3-oxoacyl-[acyl-carrier-protein] synthase II